MVGAGPPTKNFLFRTKESRAWWPYGHRDEVATTRVNLQAGWYQAALGGRARTMPTQSAGMAQTMKPTP